MSNKDLKLGKWTRERPTAPGWYWFRNRTPRYQEDHAKPRVIELRIYRKKLALGNSTVEGFTLLETGEWCAIPLPEEEGLSYVRHPAFDEYGEHR